MIDPTDLMRAVTAHEATLGNDAEAARQLGIPRSTFQNWLKQAERKGLTGNTLYGKALEGFDIVEVSTETDADGRAKREWTTQRPESGQPLTQEQLLPTGQRVRGISTLIDAENRMVAQWFKTEREEQKLQDFISIVKEELQEIPHYGLPIDRPVIMDGSDWMVALPIVDHHMGMYSWAKETGQNYDLDIAKRALLGTTSRLIDDAPDAEVCFIVSMGDFFHMDNYENRTGKSLNPLDGDGRYPKVLQMGVAQWKMIINKARQKYPKVNIRILPGNHDPKGAIVLAMCLAEAFENDPTVTIDGDPSAMFFEEWGDNMLAGHHGDKIKPGDFIGKMAAIKPEMWGRTKFRYSWSGHVHRMEKGKSGLELDGAQYEVFEASTARDAWNAEMGFTSNRSMQWRAYHKDGAWKSGGVYIKGE